MKKQSINITIPDDAGVGKTITRHYSASMVDYDYNVISVINGLVTGCECLCNPHNSLGPMYSDHIDRWEAWIRELLPRGYWDVTVDDQVAAP